MTTKSNEASPAKRSPENQIDSFNGTTKIGQLSESKYYTDREAIKHLKELHLQISKVKHPSLPYHSCPDYSATNTNGLTKCVIAFLKLKGAWCERTGSEGRVIDNRETVQDILGNHRTIGSIARVRSSGTTGTSDLKACINGKFIAIEIKCAATGDKIRPAQLEYKKHIEASGATYLIVTSFAQFVSWYQDNYGG